MKRLAAIVALLPVLAFAGSNNSDFSVDATFVPSKKPSSPATISVLFKAAGPDVRINEDPAPRIKLSPDQKVLSYTPPAGVMAPPTFDPAFAKYLDLSKPVTFGVSHDASIKGSQKVAGSVIYFYCSKKEGWCKKGSTDFEVDVRTE